jgi:hypothetical protein
MLILLSWDWLMLKISVMKVLITMTINCQKKTLPCTPTLKQPLWNFLVHAVVSTWDSLYTEVVAGTWNPRDASTWNPHKARITHTSGYHVRTWWPLDAHVTRNALEGPFTHD